MENYREYVGNPAMYDLIGANQFCLLHHLGLRAHHYLLDFGCGGLRAGRILIPFLNRERYYGIEPNFLLVRDAIQGELGEEIISMKRPQFNTNARFDLACWPEVHFDFILAQSIFSHTPLDQIVIALKSGKQALKPNGVMMVTFAEGEKDYEGATWAYPQVITYQKDTIQRMIWAADLEFIRLPWKHTGVQTWYLIAKQIRGMLHPHEVAPLTGFIHEHL